MSITINLITQRQKKCMSLLEVICAQCELVFFQLQHRSFVIMERKNNKNL